MIRYVFPLLLALFIFLSLSGCDESLPSYSQPELNFKTEIIPVWPDTLGKTFTYTEQGDLWDKNWVPARWYGPSTEIQMSFANSYEETLQGAALLQGKIDIWSDDYPLYRTTIPLTIYNAGTTTMIDQVKKILTMNPGQKLWLKASWNYKLDNGNWINTILPIKSENVISAVRTIRTHEPALFKMRVSIQLFQNSSPVVTPDYEFIFSLVGTVRFKP